MPFAVNQSTLGKAGQMCIDTSGKSTDKNNIWVEVPVECSTSLKDDKDLEHLLEHMADSISI